VKRDRHGQGAIISDLDYAKIRQQLKAKKSRLLLDIARYTGERWGAIIQLRVEDVYDGAGRPRDYITFRAATRKARPDGQRETRQVPVHPTLKEILEGHKPPSSELLFESPVLPGKPISLRAADFMLRLAIASAGLEHKGYSTHSTRRTFITRLYERGVDLREIQLITGHHDLKALLLYVETDPERVKRAIAVL
jgi:integrase/recombinase XerD